MTDQSDYRDLRSEECQVALRIFLQRSCVKMGVDTLVLVDGSGQALAATDETVDADDVARHAAALSQHGTQVPSVAGRPQAAWTVDLGQERGYLVAFGKVAITDSEMDDTRQGILRIIADS